LWAQVALVIRPSHSLLKVKAHQDPAAAIDPFERYCIEHNGIVDGLAKAKNWDRPYIEQWKLLKDSFSHRKSVSKQVQYLNIRIAAAEESVLACRPIPTPCFQFSAYVHRLSYEQGSRFQPSMLRSIALFALQLTWTPVQPPLVGTSILELFALYLSVGGIAPDASEAGLSDWQQACVHLFKIQGTAIFPGLDALRHGPLAHVQLTKRVLHVPYMLNWEAFSPRLRTQIQERLASPAASSTLALSFQSRICIPAVAVPDYGTARPSLTDFCTELRSTPHALKPFLEDRTLHRYFGGRSRT